MLDTFSACEGVVDHTFIETDPSSYWGVLTHERDKRICKNYGGCSKSSSNFYFTFVPNDLDLYQSIPEKCVVYDTLLSPL